MFWDRVCKAGGKLIIPTYVNNEKTGKTSGFAKTVGNAWTFGGLLCTLPDEEEFGIKYGKSKSE